VTWFGTKTSSGRIGSLEGTMKNFIEELRERERRNDNENQTPSGASALGREEAILEWRRGRRTAVFVLQHFGQKLLGGNGSQI
jgi:hypothetical protein